MVKTTIFIQRLHRIGIMIKLTANYPLIYISEINGKAVSETFQANHGFALAFTPIRKDQELHFSNLTEIFKLLRKYLNNNKLSASKND